MAMHLVNAESLIRDLWYQIFRSEEGGIPASQRQNLQYKRPGLALYFKVDINISNYGYEKDGNTYRPEWKRDFRKRVHILVTINHRVYVAVTDNRELPSADE